MICNISVILLYKLICILLFLYENRICSYVYNKKVNTNKYYSAFSIKLSTSTGQNSVTSSSAPRQYVPRSSPLTTTSNEQPSSPRVYKPRSETMSKSPQSQMNSSNQNRVYRPSNNAYNDNINNNNSPALVLSKPQIILRYKIPKIKTDFKKELEELQKSFREQSESRSYGGNSYGGGNNKFSKDGGGGSSFFDVFEPPGSGDNKKRGNKGSKEKDRKDSDNNRKSESDRVRGGIRSTTDDDAEDLSDAYDIDTTSLIDDDDEENDDDYYGDDTTITTLADVPVDNLRVMELEGYTLEDIQVALYGEYGVKASLGAIKKKMQDAASDRKSRKKTGKTRRDRQKSRNAKIAASRDKGIVLPDQSSIQITELASIIDIGGGEIVKYLMLNKGMMTSMTQSIDMNIGREIVVAFGKKLAESNNNDEDEDEDEEPEEEVDEIYNGRLVEKLPRSPVVTIMGHVDHGKTSLLDSIRKSNVAIGEAGGITQGISAFKVKTKDDNYITFIDTPGHAAFSEMRKRGANVTDIVVLVVAADDGIMEQTKECIAAAKAANCPIVVAINKIDKEGADIQQIITDLTSYDILVEDYGGEVQCAKVSAKNGIGIDELLEKILLQTEIMGLKAPIDIPASGTLLEARVDKGLGVVVTALIQKGTLKIGDYVLAGPSWGKVRKIISDQNKDLKEAGPSTPVQIVGMTNVPSAGDTIVVTSNEADAREVAESRQRLAKQASGSLLKSNLLAQATGIALGTIDSKEIIKVPILIKGDVSGSVEALRQSIDNLELNDSTAICKADIVYSGVGDVTSSDVAVAAVSKAKILAFNVGSGYNAMEEARASNVEIGYYNVVYDLLDELEEKIKYKLAPPPPGILIGSAEIKKVFKIGKVGKVAGCNVLDGMIKFDSQVRIMRGKRNPVFTGKLSQLKVVKDDVQEVPSGSDCGLSFDDYQDFEEGDIVECYNN